MAIQARVVPFAELISTELPRECRRAHRLDAASAVVALDVGDPSNGPTALARLALGLRETDLVALLPDRSRLIAVCPVVDDRHVCGALARVSDLFAVTDVTLLATGVSVFPLDHEPPERLVELALERMAAQRRQSGGPSDSEPVAPSRAVTARPTRGRRPTRQVVHNEHRPLGRAWRTFELGVTAMLLVAAAPLLAACAVAIKLTSPGPVLFSQPRTGLQGQTFRVYKLRTMVADAVDLLPDLLPYSELEGQFKMTDDPRVTPVGRLLRKASIDELPQLWNIVRGDMALVGPRPTSKPPEQHTAWELERLRVKPGLTGPWQVHHRGQLSFDDRARLDIGYARQRSVAIDVRLLVQTIPTVVLMRGRH